MNGLLFLGGFSRINDGDNIYGIFFFTFLVSVLVLVVVPINVRLITQEEIIYIMFQFSQ